LAMRRQLLRERNTLVPSATANRVAHSQRPGRGEESEVPVPRRAAGKNLLTFQFSLNFRHFLKLQPRASRPPFSSDDRLTTASFPCSPAHVLVASRRPPPLSPLHFLGK
jgi:hypothetical protein